MARVTRFEDLDAWQRARELAGAIYRQSESGRFASDFGLRDQIRRAAVSVMSNVAEGFERGGDQEFVQFLATAKGSCGELRAQLYIAKDQGYLNDDEFAALHDAATEVSRLIAGLMKYLRQSPLKGSKYR
jgi:four helix bundle protein